jgi:hypothetical protein
MIISFKHKFIFFHCRKTAGTSIQNLLSNFLGSDDIILGSIAIKDSIKSKLTKRMVVDAIFHPHIDGLKKMIKELSFNDFIDLSNKKYYQKILGYAPQHAKAKTIKENFPQIWNKFFKFCVVRNTYDQTYSEYLWMQKNRKKKINFSSYLDELILKKKNFSTINESNTNWEIYTINDKPVMNYIINYENINEGLNHVLRILKITGNHVLPFSNITKDSNNNYSRVINASDEKKIKILFGKEIEYFKFKKK